MVYKTEGIIIKRGGLGETGRLLTVYTKDFGKILVRAKAIKRGQAKLKGHLELFLRSYLMLAQGRHTDVVTNAETIESFSVLHQSLAELSAAYYFAELIDKLLVAPEKDEKIWRLVLAAFQELNKKKHNLEILTKRFEKRLLELLGYGGDEKMICSLANAEIHSKRFLQRINFEI